MPKTIGAPARAMAASANGWVELLNSRNFRRPGDVSVRADMDDKTINLWRQIEGARRVGKRQAGRAQCTAPPPRPTVAS